MNLLVTNDLAQFSDSPISGAFPCRKFQLSDGRWCFHCEQVQPTETQVLAIINPDPVKVAKDQAKALLAAKDGQARAAEAVSDVHLDKLNAVIEGFNALCDMLSAKGPYKKADTDTMKIPAVQKTDVTAAVASKIDAQL